MTRHLNPFPFMEKLLTILKDQEGKAITIKKIVNHLNAEALKKSKSRKRKKNTSFLTNRDLEQAIALLEEYGLAFISKGKVIPAHPFYVEARISVAKSGSAFAMGMFPDDIFIAPPDRKNAKQGDIAFIELISFRGDRFRGRVQEIIHRHADKFFAEVIRKTDKNQNYLIQLCDLPDSPFALLQTNHTNLAKHSFCFVKPLNQTKRVYIQEIGKRGRYQNLQVYDLLAIADQTDLQNDLERIYLKYNVKPDYPQDFIPSEKDLIRLTKKEWKNPNRKDLTKLTSITIDGKDSKDFDDAISIEKAKQGYTLYVHIADVSFYVNVNSALDKEAFRRGNSWYLANSVIPMLPAVLSEKICSLNPKTKRLAFTCEMQFNKAGEIVSYSFYKSKIYLKRRYTYEQAEKELKKKKGKLSLFYELTKILEEKRNKEGRIALEIPEMQADWDETGRLISIRQKERLESHKLIEECMLSANICAARYAKKHRLPFLYRVHEKPPAEEVEKINLFLQLFGISKRIKKISAKSIASILNSISDEDTKAIFHYLLLRTFTQAVYAPDTIGHWGLGFSDYAHFTSPIRRYADLVIHRQLAAHLEKKPLPYNEGDLKFIGMETSRCEREAMSAERDIRKLLIGRSFETRIGENFEAWITGFHSEGIFIALSESIAEGFIPVQYVSKKAELLMLDELRAVADKLGKTLIMGQKLQVKLLEVDFAKIRMNFEPIL